MTRFTLTSADAVAVGSILANIGIVTEKVAIGVFIVFGVRGTTRRLADGRMDVETFDVVRHCSEQCVIEEITQ